MIEKVEVVPGIYNISTLMFDYLIVQYYSSSAI